MPTLQLEAINVRSKEAIHLVLQKIFIDWKFFLQFLNDIFQLPYQNQDKSTYKLMYWAFSWIDE